VADNVSDLRPVGERLGSQRLYDEYLPDTPPELNNLQPVAGQTPQKPKVRRPRGKQRKQPQTPPQQSPVPAKQATANWREISSTALELTGVVAITVGCALLAVWLAFVVGGILLVLLGVATGWNVTE
jgi:hypothetical protein